jgi:8-oxo-dGTP diphosphatase
MTKPLLRAEVIIIHNNGKQVLVQCDNEETFYRFPGGSIEFGESAAEAIKRELIEEFDLQSTIGSLACLNENIVEYNGKKRHDCTILHWGLIDESLVQDSLNHNEKQGIKITWRTFEQLKQKPLYPEGILDFLIERLESVSHLLVMKTYNE